jgi:hypothetical protein
MMLYVTRSWRRAGIRSNPEGTATACLSRNGMTSSLVVLHRFVSPPSRCGTLRPLNGTLKNSCDGARPAAAAAGDWT